jgi:hypothetical protein
LATIAVDATTKPIQIDMKWDNLNKSSSGIIAVDGDTTAIPGQLSQRRPELPIVPRVVVMVKECVRGQLAKWVRLS